MQKNYLQKLFVFIGLIFSILPTVSGQDLPCCIKGLVVDINSKEPVPSAVIHIQPLDKYFTTNAEGEFLIDKIENEIYRLTISHIAYKDNTLDIDLNVKSNVNIMIYLYPKSI